MCEAIWIPTCWYRQCESLVLEVLPNAKPQHEAPMRGGLRSGGIEELNIIEYESKESQYSTSIRN